jgi:hypothetical protein
MIDRRIAITLDLDENTVLACSRTLQPPWRERQTLFENGPRWGVAGQIPLPESGICSLPSNMGTS